MAITLKLLGKADVPQTGIDIYTVPAGKCAVIKTMSMVNARWASDVSVNIYLVKGANSRQISPLNAVLQPGGQLIVDEMITLGAGDKLRINASEHLKVDAVVCGVERDA